MATEIDYYTTLGVARTATDADIKKAFRKLAQQWHPDVNTDAGAQERFKEINEAYQVLSDPGRRATYDRFGKAGLGADGGAGFDPSAFAGPTRRSSSRSTAAATRARAAAPSPARSRSPATTAAVAARSRRPAGRCSARCSA